MNILKYLKLDEKQTKKLNAWSETLPTALTEEEFDELDCCLTGFTYNFHYTSSGIGDCLSVTTTIRRIKYTCILGYDDEGNLL